MRFFALPQIGRSMLYAVSWFLVLALLATWSTCVWALHSLVVWSMSGAGALAGQSQHLEGRAVAGWAGSWLPPDWLPLFQSGASSALAFVASAFSVLPTAVAWLTPLAWVVWGIGLLVLLVGGVALHALIFTARKRARQ